MGAFAVENAPERKLVRDLVIASPIGVWDSFDVTIEDRLRYLRSIRESGLVACPRGRGIDTYRLWETLYMGAVPVVASLSKNSRRSLSGLPFIELESWGQLANRDDLMNHLEQLRAGRFEQKTLRIDSLIEVITS